MSTLPADEAAPRTKLTVGIVDEARDGERRVAASPASVRALVAAEHTVIVQSNAGIAAGWPDKEYTDAGAVIAGSTAEVLKQASVLLCVRGSGAGAATWTGVGSSHILAGLLDPLGEPATMKKLAQSGATVFAIDLLPRITRAQPMDVLSSQATVAGYKAVIVAASLSPRLFPMLTYAAGTIPPAKVLVLGVGVAGLQALATARRLGAQTTGYDVRPEVAEQVGSLGAKWLDLGIEASGEGGYARALTVEEQAEQQQALTEAIKGFDVVITTALVPGRPAPKLVTAEAVEGMKPGSVIVDLAGETGGNCELTTPGQLTVEHDVTIVSPLNIAAEMPEHASQLYARNVQALLELFLDEHGELALDFDDEIVAGSAIVRDGKIVNDAARAVVEAAA
jgi:NAD(P) transhydrogenase subunit alpha